MKWISVKTCKPKLKQKCLCYIKVKRIDGSIYTDISTLYYIKYAYDKRKHVFSEKIFTLRDSGESEYGEQNWSVTHWMPLPYSPNKVLNLNTQKE